MITFTQGDTPTLVLYAQDGDGNLMDLSGAVFTTQILSDQKAKLTIANAAHTADSNQTTHKGKFTIALTADDTQKCGIGSGKDIVTKIVQSGGTVYLHGSGILTVLPNFPTV